jgi:hypothetical protein
MERKTHRINALRAVTSSSKELSQIDPNRAKPRSEHENENQNPFRTCSPAEIQRIRIVRNAF